MSRLTILDNLRIASPCEADWSKMAGDDRTRFCGDCSKHVYNIAAMTADEATDLILASEGRLCIQIYRRSDGTVLTADCPVGLGRISAGRRIRRIMAVGLVLPALVVAGVTAKGFGKKRIEPFPMGPGVTWDMRVDWALVTMGFRKRSAYTRGFLDDVQYIEGQSFNSTQAATQRARMQAAGIPVPPPPISGQDCPTPPGSSDASNGTRTLP